jgi:hypothetical protein
MGGAIYRVVRYQDGWGVEHDGGVAGPYVSKEAAFEAAVGPATNAIKLGDEVDIRVPGGDRGSTLGTRER